MKTLRAILTAGLFSLAACQSTGGACPPLVSYSPETQRLAAAELRKLPKDSHLARLVTDYGKTRAAIRACRGD